MLQIAFDKENCSSGNQQLLKSARTPAESMKKSGQKMLSFSSRKVLGDINNQQAVYSDQPAKSTHGYSKPSKDWKDLQSHKKENSFIRKQENSLDLKTIKDGKVSNRCDVFSKSENSQWWLQMEKENMNLGTVEEDNYEDIIPFAERPSTYVDKLLAWRPSSLNVFCEAADKTTVTQFHPFGSESSMMQDNIPVTQELACENEKILQDFLCQFQADAPSDTHL